MATRRLVLVVEDDYSTQHLLEIVLRARGYQVASASNAEDALRILHEKKVDLIVLDLVLPGASGIDFLRARRELASALQVPVIVISAIPELDALRTELRYLGASVAIRKPFDLEQLIAALQTHGRKRRSRAAHQPQAVEAQV